MSNKYTYQKHSNHRTNVTTPPSQHSRAATYTKSKPHAYNKNKTKPKHTYQQTHHLPATNATLNDIETTRSDMRDILWQNAELLQSDPNYRKKVWRYMSKVFYGNQSTAYNFDNYKKFQLPTSIRGGGPQRNNNSSLHGLRQQNENKESNSNLSSSDVDIMTKDKLKLLLDREETYSDFLINSNPNQVILMNKVRPKMERILEAYACANNNKFALSGAVQLCAVILTTFNASCKPSIDDNNNNNDGIASNVMNINYSNNSNDCQDTFFILQILTQIMKIYYDSDEKLMKDETLLLIDVLCVNEDKLVRKLNNLEIDVIDLSVFVSSWIRCLFVHHFEIEFVQRVIDLVLLEGPSVLIAIVYGILQFIKNDILQCDTHYDVFEKLAGNKLKNYLKKHEFIHRVIQKAQLLFTEENYKYVIKGREKKSWPDLLGLPGQRHFRIAKGVGDKTKVKKAYQHWRRESRKNITNAYLGAEESSDDSEEDDEQQPNGSNHHQRNSSTGFLTGDTNNNTTTDNDNNNTTDNDDKLQEIQNKLQAANDTIERLQKQQQEYHQHHQHQHQYSDSMNIHKTAIPEDEQIGSTVIESNNSLIIHSNTNDDNIGDHSPKHSNKKPSAILMSHSHKTATSQLAAKNNNNNRSQTTTKHNKSAPTLSDILYTSQFGETIYQEPITDNLAPREIQCRTENWTDSWKNALNSLTDASISMQGYLCKMTASKWNSRGTLDKIQRRWFVLRGNYMTYYKTNLHTQPKSDKCVNLLGYKVNPVIHNKSKYAFELISPPKENIHKKSKSQKKSSMQFNVTASNNDDNNDKTKDFYERTKFILIPDLDVNESKQREIRDKWVKSLRLATKGAFLWDVLLNLQVENPSDNDDYNNNNDDHHHSHHHGHPHSSHSHHGHHYNHRTVSPSHQSTKHGQTQSSHTNSQTAFVVSSHHSSSYHNLTDHHHHHHHHHQYDHNNNNNNDNNKGNQSPLSSQRIHNNNNNELNYNRRQYQNKKRNQNKRGIGGNTQDYPDYNVSHSNNKRNSGYPYNSKSTPSKNEKLYM